ncbi:MULTISPECIES: carbonate dehydratase [unclassified Halomonas]|mgnify:FL=1|uniref:Carbonic anhydrase n=2 Tax=unclassified Halomonas TaxID=2609666 RepID=A0AAU7KMR5_9GAMM|nr:MULTISPECIES: carbonate dehydratase [unclassified Halomonas]MBR9770590.1 carbonate dehydratase [Gammaproteobacteria bacterium]MBS8268049.1 carbonate dehydratase [Halomonas litopenaei]KJZ16828.1 carbonate dehydratase [Halomonas sp. S2151]MAY70257.1 carbonate dehydratase [Halomonas sp.]MBY5942432.1 carbonate dehydratase [Halomonas sp. DP5N14-9]|tara:strand:- start:136 stop:783 length:648 start_codon:yes stop_codon:yes gene_type:complete
MSDIDNLLANNRAWADRICQEDPDFFARLAQQQSPEYLWIGCSDSRVPANQIIDLPPGEVFVHRNVANLLYHNDMNALSVVQFAVDVLKVRHIMIVGHYNCGGVRAAVTGGENGMVDNWLHSVRELYSMHRSELEHLPLDEQVDRMCELNVKSQVKTLCRTKIVQRAWQRGQALSVHGWVYGLSDGRVTDLECSVHGLDQVAQLYRIDRVCPPQQ